MNQEEDQDSSQPSLIISQGTLSEDKRSKSLDDLTELIQVEAKVPSVRERRSSQPVKPVTEADLHDVQVCMLVCLVGIN